MHYGAGNGREIEKPKRVERARGARKRRIENERRGTDSWLWSAQNWPLFVTSGYLAGHFRTREYVHTVPHIRPTTDIFNARNFHRAYRRRARLTDEITFSQKNGPLDRNRETHLVHRKRYNPLAGSIDTQFGIPSDINFNCACVFTRYTRKQNSSRGNTEFIKMWEFKWYNLRARARAVKVEVTMKCERRIHECAHLFDLDDRLSRNVEGEMVPSVARLFHQPLAHTRVSGSTRSYVRDRTDVSR